MVYMLAMTVFVYVCFAQQETNFAQLTMDLQNIISSPTSTDEELLQSIAKLGKVTEPPMFWVQIANDHKYSEKHRIRAVFALFRRHCQFCEGVFEFSKRLDGSKWIEECEIHKLSDVVPGFAGFVSSQNCSAFCIAVIHGPHLYLKLEDIVSVESFREIMRGRATPGMDGRVLDISYADDYDEWFCGQPRNHKVDIGWKRFD